MLVSIAGFDPEKMLLVRKAQTGKAHAHCILILDGSATSHAINEEAACRMLNRTVLYLAMI